MKNLNLRENLMGYGRGSSFPFDSEPNGFPFGSKSKGKLSPRSYPIQCERKWKYSFLSVSCLVITIKRIGWPRYAINCYRWLFYK